MSRFLLADSLATVGSSVLLYVLRLTEKNGRKIRDSVWLSFVNSSLPPVCCFSCSVSFPLYPFLPPAPSRSLSLCHLSPFFPPLSFSLFPPVPLFLSLFLTPHPRCLPHALLSRLFSLRLLPIHLTVYLSICLSLEAPRAARATCTAAKLKNDAGSRRMPPELTATPMKEGYRFSKMPTTTPLSLPPSLSLSLSLPPSRPLFLFLSPSLFPGMNAGGG